MSPGKYALIPAGSVPFQERYSVDPLTDTFLKESREEIGLGFDYENPELVGILFSYH